MEDEKWNANMVQLAKQGACTRWEITAWQLSHREVLETSNKRLKFLVKSFYDILPTPANKNFGLVRMKSVCCVEGSTT